MLRLSTTLLAEGPKDSGATLVVGPSLGTAVTPLWQRCAELLGRRWRVIGWDLPGHGYSTPTSEGFGVADLAEAVTEAVHSTGVTGRAWYAGVSVSGTVGLQLALDHPDDWAGFAIICSAAKIMDEQRWRERAELVRRAGTPVMVSGSSKVWFAPGSIERDPDVATALLNSLQDADSESYSRVCEALGGFDARERLSQLPAKLLVISGRHDGATPPDLGQMIADASESGHLHVIESAAHLAPAEAPQQVADLLLDTTTWTRTSDEQ